MQILARSVVSVGLVAGAVACTASLDLDRFRTAPAEQNSTSDGGSTSSSSSSGLVPSTASHFDVRYSARAMQSHLNEYFELRVVDKSNGVQAKAVYNDVTSPDFELYLARAVPKTNPPYRLDFWADHNRSTRYDGIVGGINDKDHAWRRVLTEPLPEDVIFSGSRYDLSFLHDTAFVDMFSDLEGNKISGEETLLTFTANLTGAGAYAGKMFELRVIDKFAERLVGLYREGRTRDTFQPRITDILDSGTTFEVAAYVDANDSGRYDSGDPSWKLDFTSTSEGGTISLDLATAAQAPISTGQE